MFRLPFKFAALNQSGLDVGHKGLLRLSRHVGVENLNPFVPTPTHTTQLTRYCSEHGPARRQSNQNRGPRKDTISLNRHFVVINTLQPLKDAKWVKLQKLFFTDPEGTPRDWECASRQTRVKDSQVDGKYTSLTLNCCLYNWLIADATN